MLNRDPRARARRWGPCDGCGHPYRADEHVPGQKKCCPDCTHTASLPGSEEAHTVDVGFVHVLTEDGACTPTCPHPDHHPKGAPDA